MNYKLIRSNRKTISAEILRDGTLLVRAPLFCSENLILHFLHKNQDKIIKRQEMAKALPPIPSISRAEAEILRQKARGLVLPRVEYFAKLLGLEYHSVKITSARRRFGSCSSKKNLCFSLFLALLSPCEIDYVVLHELCHTVHMNHSKRFYSLIETHMPDWKEREALLKKRVLPQIEN